MNIFVINSGSSSIKYQLFKTGSDRPVCSGLVDRIGLEGASITHKYVINGEEGVLREDSPIPDHETGMVRIGQLLTQPGIAVISDPAEVQAVGHRVVHGGETLTKTTVITPEVKEKIRALYQLAPLHNPGHYKGITVAEKIFPQATQIAAFDTAFHQTIPAKAFRYAIPGSFYQNDHIRVYGFHGISHQYVSRQSINYLGDRSSSIITIHLGNGCSMAAVKDGRCIDTSMGLTPLDGLIMGTRSGNIDPSVLLYLIQEKGYDAATLNGLLNKQSGMLGLTGHSDMRDISKLIAEGDESAKLAYEMYAYRIKKFIGAYAAAMNGLDAIVFTAGVGENDALVRQMVCEGMTYLGLQIDTDKNAVRSGEIREINTADSRVKILVVPTNEEREIATQCENLLNQTGK